MDKPIIFEGLEDFVIPRCDVTINSDHDDNGNPFITFQIKKIPDSFIRYTNDRKYGIVPDTSPNKDLIVAIMELGADPSPESISDFFTNYGFFFSKLENNENKLIRYTKNKIVKVFHYIQDLVILHNYSALYNAYKDTNIIDSLFDNTHICNSMIKSAYIDIFSLQAENEFILTDSHINETNDYQFGLNYHSNFDNLCNTFKLPRSEYYYRNNSGGNIFELRNSFDDYIDYCNNNSELTIDLDQTNTTRPNGKAITISDSERILSEFLLELRGKRKLKYKHDINEYIVELYIPLEIEREIPYVTKLGNSNTIRDRIMNIVSMIIREKLNGIIKNVHPQITNISDNHPSISWNFENLLCVIFTELACLETNGFECRACCKEECPDKGKYFFIIDVKNKTKKCHNKACRTKVNKRIFDENHKSDQ